MTMPKQLADKFTFRYDALIDEIVGNCDGCYSACNFDPLSWGIGVQN